MGGCDRCYLFNVYLFRAFCMLGNVVYVGYITTIKTEKIPAIKELFKQVDKQVILIYNRKYKIHMLHTIYYGMSYMHTHVRVHTHTHTPHLKTM